MHQFLPRFFKSIDILEKGLNDLKKSVEVSTRLIETDPINGLEFLKDCVEDFKPILNELEELRKIPLE